VAVARRRVDDRHLRDRLERLLQPLAAARDHEVDDALLRAQLGELLPPAAGHERERARRQPRGLARLARDPRQDCVGVRGGGGPAQHDRVAGLQAQRRGVDRHVRARLVDHGHHPERHAHLAHLQAVGEGRAVDHLADGIRQRDDVAHALGDRGDPPLVQREAIHQGV
jgi:hypothetical protein